MVLLPLFEIWLCYLMLLDVLMKSYMLFVQSRVSLESVQNFMAALAWGRPATVVLSIRENTPGSNFSVRRKKDILSDKKIFTIVIISYIIFIYSPSKFFLLYFFVDGLIQ